jgi:D-lactate dehydrogenase (cytochrome)
MQAGVPVARIELLDEAQMEACIAYSKLEGLKPVPTLFLEFHGSEAGVAEQAEMVQHITAEHGGSGFSWARDAEARNRLWKARHDAYWAGIAWRPGKKGITTDVCVPISRLAEALLGAKADIAASGFEAPIVGHVGDGNFHTIILVDEGDAAQMERAWALDRQIVARALDLGGTCSGEHGVGLGKREFLEREHGPEAMAVMRALKDAMDPKGILNPGKIFRDSNT